MKIRPINDRVLVKRLEMDEKTEGGLYMPDSAREKPNRGEVIAVGPGRMLDNGTREQMEVKEGDIVLFGKYSGSELQGKEELITMKEKDILGILEAA